MKQKLLLLVCCFLSVMLFSQSEPKAFLDWSGTTGSQSFFYKNVSALDKDGNVYVAGATIAANGFTDILLTKYYANGEFAWSQQYDGLAHATDFAAAMIIDGDANIYLTGTVSNDTVTPNQTDLIIIKYDTDGTLQWVNTYDRGVNSIDGGSSIVNDESGNLYVTGGSYNSSYNSDIVVICYNSSGTEQWVNFYNHSTELDDIGYKINQYDGEKIIVTGAVTDSPGNYYLKTLELAASDGSILDDATSTSVTSSSVNAVTDVAIDAQKNIYIIGTGEATGNWLDFYTVKLDSNLTVLWEQSYNNGSNNLNDVPNGLDVDSLGNVYVTGYSESSTQGKNFVTIKYDNSGSQQWVQNFNNPLNTDDEAMAVVVDSLGNIYVTGGSMSDINMMDYYTIKYDPSGTKLWEIQSDANHLNDKATNIALDNNLNVVITGQCETAPNVFEYRTEKYVQKDIITPTDFNNETPSNNFRYYTNKGQLIKTDTTLAPEIKFYTHNTNPLFYFKNNSLSMVFARIDTLVATDDTLHRIDLSFTNSYENAKTYPTEQKRDGYLNYFLAHTPDGVTSVFGSERLTTTNLYNNIDLMYSSNQNGIKYYFIVKPGGDMRDIKLDFAGASSFSLNGTTNALSINSSIGSLTFDRPTVYQLSPSNATVAVTGWTADWQTDGASNKYNFNTGSYTSSLTLVIEVDQSNTSSSAAASIQNLNYSTYYGGSGNETFNAVRVNQNTNRRYIAGTTNSNTFPISSNIFPYIASNDAVILGYTGTDSLIFATYYGGSNYDVANNIAIQSNGNIYVTGRTQSLDLSIKTTNKPTASQQTTNGYYSPSGTSSLEDGFILELNYRGNNHVWSRYLGGIYTDGIGDIEVDANDNLYIVGNTNSANFPTLNAYKYLLGGSTYTHNYDWFIMKFNSQSQIQWSTFFGGDNIPPTPIDFNIERAYAVDVDNSTGKIYVGGMISGSIDFPAFNNTGNTSSTAFYNSNVTGNGGALVRFSSNGTPDLSTQLASVSQLTDLKIMPDNSILMIGNSSASSSTFSHKIKSGAYNKTYFDTNEKGVILQMNNNIDSLWSTFYNNTNTNASLAFNRIAVADNGGFCLSGTTNLNSLVFPASSPSGLFTNTTRQQYDGYISYFSSQGSLYHAHYLGGNSADNAYDIDFYKHQDLYVVGNTYGNFPIASTPQNVNLIDQSYNLGSDGYISRFDLSGITISVKELDSDNLSIKPYPNPVTDYFLINTSEFKNNKFTSITVYDITGREVYTKGLNENNTDVLKINCGHWANGLYLLNIVSGENKYSGKLIKQ